MISTHGITLQYGEKPLFEDVSIKFTEGNCYGLIGANGAGKSTFLKILAGEITSNKGTVSMPPKSRLAVLKQDHYAYDEYTVLDTVMMGHSRLYEIMKEKELLYMKEDFNDEDGHKLGELEGEFNEMDGYSAESNASILLNNLGVEDSLHDKLMSDMEDRVKVKVLLAQALFGNPDVLLLDEPTNHLDVEAINWLQDFLGDFPNTVIVVSHDRYFLNQVCTHVADIDYNKIELYVGNYDFWYESSQLALKQARDTNKKMEAKAKEMQDFIQRFSANASKSKQATSRKKALDKLVFTDIKPSSRKYPYINFKPLQNIGEQVLHVEELTKSIDGEKVIDNLSFTLNSKDKVAIIGTNTVLINTLFKILSGEMEPDEGTLNWGVTTSRSYLPSDSGAYFDGVTDNLVEWLREFSVEKDETFIRGFLGRMLFSGDDSQKEANVLSGGERVRCLFAKMMLQGGNVVLLEEPTNHLDLESITALNNALIETEAVVVFSSHDHQFISTVANRIIEVTDTEIIDREMSYDEYLEFKKTK